MTRSEIIAHCKALTMNRSEGKDLNHEILFVTRLQRICLEKHWWFRKKYLSLSVTSGEPSYDLSDQTINPDRDIAEISKVFYLDGGKAVELTPVTDDVAQITAIEDTTQALPSRYLIEPGTSWTLRLSPVPSSARTIYVAYWAAPTVIESSSDTVPLIPSHLHHLLVLGLELDITRYLFGTESQKYVAAKQEYEEAKYLAQANPYPTSEVERRFVATGAIRST